MLTKKTLFSYLVVPERLDIFVQFLSPAQCRLKKHKAIEATDIMLQMVASGRGVAALPKWLVQEYAEKLPIQSVRLGEEGIAKKIFLGVRESCQVDCHIDAFVTLAKTLAC